MNPRDVFGIVVRSIGLLAITYALIVLPGIFFPQADTRHLDYLFAGIPTALLGSFLLLKADAIVDASYPRPGSAPPTAQIPISD